MDRPRRRRRAPSALGRFPVPPGMDLPLEKHWIDDHAEVVDAHVALDSNDAGLRIDLDLADVAAVGISGDFAFRNMGKVERYRRVLRERQTVAKPCCEFNDTDRAIGPGNAKFAATKLKSAGAASSTCEARLLLHPSPATSSPRRRMPRAHRHSAPCPVRARCVTAAA